MKKLLILGMAAVLLLAAGGADVARAADIKVPIIIVGDIGWTLLRGGTSKEWPKGYGKLDLVSNKEIAKSGAPLGGHKAVKKWAEDHSQNKEIMYGVAFTRTSKNFNQKDFDSFMAMAYPTYYGDVYPRNDLDKAILATPGTTITVVERSRQYWYSTGTLPHQGKWKPGKASYYKYDVFVPNLPAGFKMYDNGKPRPLKITINNRF